MSARQGVPAVIAAVFLLTLFSITSEAATSGIEGLAAYRGDFVSGATILAFEKPGMQYGSDPVARSGPTDDDGRYRLSLPPGRYYLIAVKHHTATGGRTLAPGDLFCYYLGNPILVEEGLMTRVGFNMIRVSEEETLKEDGRSGIAGKVTFEGDPLGRSYLYVYRDGSTNFRGMGLSTLPADEKGNFRLRLAPGNYYLLARKRLAGGMYGPPQKDDYIGYYHGNPIEVRQGEFRNILLETTTRIDLLEELWFKEGQGGGWFRGMVSDRRGQPVSGIYVLFYDGRETAGTPAFMAGPTGSDGRFQVRAAPGSFRILARGSIGGPPEPGEWYGQYKGAGGEEEVEATSAGEIQIAVERSP